MSQRRSQQLHVNQVRFIAEQDGTIERELKRRLTEFFVNNPTVKRAYLAIVNYEDLTTYSVALCLRASSSPDKALVEEIGGVFASIFSAKEHLDVLFLSDQHEKRMLRVCPPFYERGASTASG